jgi:hypothetical protein
MAKTTDSRTYHFAEAYGDGTNHALCNARGRIVLGRDPKPYNFDAPVAEIAGTIDPTAVTCWRCRKALAARATTPEPQQAEPAPTATGLRLSTADLAAHLSESLRESPDIFKRIDTYAESGQLTEDEGLIVQTAAGQVFYLTIREG